MTITLKPTLLVGLVAAVSLSVPARANVVTESNAETFNGGSAFGTYSVDTTSGAVKFCYMIETTAASAACTTPATFAAPSTTMRILRGDDSVGGKPENMSVAIINLANGKVVNCFVPTPTTQPSTAPTSLTAVCKTAN